MRFPLSVIPGPREDARPGMTTSMVAARLPSPFLVVCAKTGDNGGNKAGHPNRREQMGDFRC